MLLYNTNTQQNCVGRLVWSHCALVWHAHARQCANSQPRWSDWVCSCPPKRQSFLHRRSVFCINFAVKFPNLALGTYMHVKRVRDCVIFYYICSGGNTIKVWDALAGGRLLFTLKNHHKTVMDMCFCSNHSRLVSAGLDQYVQNPYAISLHNLFLHIIMYAFGGWCKPHKAISIRL